MRGMNAPQYVAVVAPKYALPEVLVRAIVQVESGGNRHAMRVERRYTWLWDVRRKRPFATTAARAEERVPPPDFESAAGLSTITEWIGQQTSWGYMQVMGAVARELGYTAHFPGLSDPLEGLHYGCRHLARLRDRFLASHGWRGVAAAYNAGTPRLSGVGFENQGYVDKVAAAGGFAGLS